MANHLTECNDAPFMVKKLAEERIAEEDGNKKLRTEKKSKKENSAETSEDDQNMADMDFVEAICTGSLPHALVDNAAFRRFVHRLNPSYTLPTRRSISEKLMPELYKLVNSSVMEAVNQAPFVALSVDGWTDVRKEAIVNVMVHTPQPFLFKSYDTGNNAHTAPYMANLLKQVIDEIGPTKVVAITSDHAANLLAAWRLIQAEYPWIILSCCKAHLLDLVVQDILKLGVAHQVMEQCKSVAKFSYKKTPNLLLGEAQLFQYNKKIPFYMPSNVRWGTNHKLLSAVIRSKEAILNILRDPRVTNLASLSNDARKLRVPFEDLPMIKKMRELEAILNPLNRAISLIEGDSMNTAEAYAHIDESFSSALQETSHIVGLGDDVKNDIKQILNSRREMGKAPIFYLARLLDPRDQGNALSEEQKLAGIQVLVEQVLKNPKFFAIKDQVMKELGEWRAHTGAFGDPTRLYAWELLDKTTIDAKSWWAGYFSDTVLWKLLDVLRVVPLTSASNERNWSMRGRIHTAIRNRLSSSIVSMETYISWNMKRMMREEIDHKSGTIQQEFSYDTNEEIDHEEVILLEDDEDYAEVIEERQYF
uniref:DUF659 domain-containing protein n=1 Tax=Acrobeloides nanus TaxID=290746 RepID=A0A914D745_9BILA